LTQDYAFLCFEHCSELCSSIDFGQEGYAGGKGREFEEEASLEAIARSEMGFSRLTPCIA
jgi:hypothetical protein